MTKTDRKQRKIWHQWHFSFFHVPKVSCNATTCSGQGICTDDGVCLCDNGFYTDNCSSKFLDLQYPIIIFVPETQPTFVFSVIVKSI